MKIGVSIRIDVTKIDKARLYKGEKGTYLDLTTMIDLDQADQYGNHGFIAQSTTKEEREQKVQTPILGNSKVFWRDGQQQQGGYQQQRPPVSGTNAQQPNPQAQQQPQGSLSAPDFDDDIPFAPLGKQYRSLLNAM